jgi:hypothetical protein
MIITDDFVFLNYPKTGTTFARHIIKKVYDGRFSELLLPESINHISKLPSQHGSLSSIPLLQKNKKIVSIIRNPFDRYVSLWKFRWYAHSPPISQKILSREYPGFPDISFREFLEMTDRFSKNNVLLAHDLNDATDLGFQTLQFVAFYGASPRENLIDTLGLKPLRIPEIIWLRQSNLRSDLKSFLLSIGIREGQLAAIDTQEELNVSRSESEKDWRKFWSDDLYDLYSRKEELLLKEFPKIVNEP